MSSGQLYCALISCGVDTLMVPNTLVVETVGLEALQVASGGPAWFAGVLEWNHQRLPALRFEGFASGSGMAVPGRRARLVVLQTPGEDGAPLAVLSQGYPHLVTVTRDAIRSEPLQDRDPGAVVLARVRVGNGEALIPDLAQWQLLAQRQLAPSPD
jgi:chemosensory pili system protein ChpC